MKIKKLLWILMLLFFPSMVYANVGTPLMWAQNFHLLIGNAVIGIIEGLLVVAIFKRPKKHSTIFFILLNYFSMLIGVAIIAFVDSYGFEKTVITIENAKIFMFVSFIYFYLITLFVEFPFILGFFWKEKDRFRKGIKATLIVNTVSYMLLFPLYWLASSATLINELEVVSTSEIDLPDNYDIYYISDNGKDFIKSDLDGKNKEIVRKDIADLASEKDFNKSFFEVGELNKNGTWEYRTGTWAVEGIKGKNNNGESFRYAVETPFISWHIKNGTHIEKDLLIFQLGSDQIVALRHDKKQISLVAKGSRPVVVQRK